MEKLDDERLLERHVGDGESSDSNEIDMIA